MNNQEFFALLEQNKAQETFDLLITNGRSVTCKPLTALHLKYLVESVVDSPLTQSLFAVTINKIFKESITNDIEYSSLTYVDKILFALSTKIASLSPDYRFTEDGQEHDVDLVNIKSKLIGAIGSNASLFEQQIVTTNNCTLTYGVPLLLAEDQINDELYKSKTDDNIQTQEQLRKILGEAFMNEIAKTIRSVEIAGNLMDFSTTTFKTRLKVVESLPASLLSSVIKYVEKYKKEIERSVTISLPENKSHIINIDGSLFTAY